MQKDNIIGNLKTRIASTDVLMKQIEIAEIAAHGESRASSHTGQITETSYHLRQSLLELKDYKESLVKELHQTEKQP